MLCVDKLFAFSTLLHFNFSHHSTSDQQTPSLCWLKKGKKIDRKRTQTFDKVFGSRDKNREFVKSPSYCLSFFSSLLCTTYSQWCSVVLWVKKFFHSERIDVVIKNKNERKDEAST